MITIDRAAAKKRVDDAKPIPIFELDGKTYNIPGVTRSEIALRYLDIAADPDLGGDQANYYLLTTMLGQEGYDALMSVDGLTKDDFDGVVEQVSKVVMPETSPKGRRR